MEDTCPRLPMEVLELIQSLMDVKTAARCAVTCSRLLAALCFTRKIDLDERLFQDAKNFWDGAVKTLQRYEKTGKALDSLKVTIIDGEGFQTVLSEVLGQTAKLCVSNIDLEIYNARLIYTIPHGTFDSSNLIDLSVRGGALNVCNEMPIICKSIRTLVLLPDRYIGRRRDMFKNYVMKCPSLEKLECCGYVLWMDIEGYLHPMHNLRVLKVGNMHYVDNYFFIAVKLAFPCLSQLMIKEIYKDREPFPVDNRANRLSIHQRDAPTRITFDAESLQNFDFSGAFWSSITTEQGGLGVVTDVHVVCHLPDHKWFASFRKLLLSVSPSIIRVAIRVMYPHPEFILPFNCECEAIQVELLDLNTVGPTPGLVDNLLRVCNPTVLRFDNGNIW